MSCESCCINVSIGYVVLWQCCAYALVRFRHKKNLSFGKDHVLASYIWLCHHKHSWRCPEVSLKMSSLQCCGPSSKPLRGFQTYKRLSAEANWSLWHGILLVWPHSLLRRGHTIGRPISVNWINSTISDIEMFTMLWNWISVLSNSIQKKYDYLMTF